MYVPPELVESHILPWLPVRSLLRFRCVCSAWRDIIDDDDSFHRDHLRLQETSLLLAPQVRHDRDCAAVWASKVVTTTGLYRWEKRQQGAAASLVHGMADHHTFSTNQAAHGMAHCDGLVLLPSEGVLRPAYGMVHGTVSVVNPATRRVLKLPWSPRMIVPQAHDRRLQSHQAFGLGRDPSSNAYKVAHFFYRSVVTLAPDGGDHYTLGNGMEIFTVGTDQCWRDIKKSSPYPIKPARTATFCKGSLFWTVEELLLDRHDKLSTPGFVRFNLEDESFSVVPPPPCCSSTLIDNEVSRLAELRGELCIAYSGPAYMSFELWMCNPLDDSTPQWDRRYVVEHEVPRSARGVCPKAMFDNEIVFQLGHYDLLRFNYWTGSECLVRDMVEMHDLRYGNPDNNDATGTLVEYTRSAVHVFDTIPYVPSLAPV